MMSIVYIFWMYVLLFAIIGAMRGWAKELLVAFSVITALAVILLLEKYIPLVRDLDKTSSSVFWIRTLILLGLVYFGYQTVASIPHLASKAEKRTITGFACLAQYWAALMVILLPGLSCFTTILQIIPTPISSAPPQTPPSFRRLNTMMNYMPPHLLGVPGIYFAIIIILIFIIVVYV